MTVKGKYTERVHARRVMRMMELGKSCPQGNHYGFEKIYENRACEICREFLGATKKFYGGYCPCYVLRSRDEAYKRTWIALDEKGYL